VKHFTFAAPRRAESLAVEEGPVFDFAVGSKMPKKCKTASVIRRGYHVVHAAFWAVGVAMAAYLLLQLPQMRDSVTAAEAKRTQDVLNENNRYCEKWGMRARTHEHVICMMDLHDIREKIEREVAGLNPF
jgi:hypothetical protein